jgi:hypothetical protein
MAARRAPERQPAPDVGATLLRERGAKLGDGQRVRQKEQDAEKDQPGEPLGAVARDGADGVDRHHRADQVEEHVETPEMPL